MRWQNNVSFETLGNIRIAADSLAPGMRILGFITIWVTPWAEEQRQAAF